LYAEGQPAEDDVEQNLGGNCYFESAEDAVALEAPQDITHDILQTGKDTFEVKLFLPDGVGLLRLGGEWGLGAWGDVVDGLHRLGFTTAPVHAEEVPVDDKFPVWTSPSSIAGVGYYSNSKQGDIWGPLIDKAFAKAWGGYDATQHGGDPAVALEAITGKGVQQITVSGNGANLLKIIKTALADHRPVVVDTKVAASSDPNYILSPDHAVSVIGTGNGSVEIHDQQMMPLSPNMLLPIDHFMRDMNTVFIGDA
jgi:hypothetical protein